MHTEAQRVLGGELHSTRTYLRSEFYGNSSVTASPCLTQDVDKLCTWREDKVHLTLEARGNVTMCPDR